MTLGADVIPNGAQTYDFVLTRLHARYGKEITNDLQFKAAPPIVGGREIISGGKLETGSRADSYNNFQGRYAIRHAWQGPILCAVPIRGRWGGPPSGQAPSGTQPATKLAFAKRGTVDLPAEIAENVPELGLAQATVGAIANPKVPEKGRHKTGCCDASGSSDFTGLLGFGALLLLRRPRQKRAR